MSNNINLGSFPSLRELVSSPPHGWSDSDVPLAKRGVQLSWLMEVIRGLLVDINRPSVDALEEAKRAFYQNRAGLFGRHDQSDIEQPYFPKYALLNVRSLVNHFVLPLTDAMRAPLWAYVPAEYRGKPDYFLSHTWNSLLLGPPRQKIGTLDAIEHLGSYVWIDFVACNQHTFESIPTDIEAVIGEIGNVIFAGTPIPMLGRIWCLWELLCANRTGTHFDIGIRPGFRNDKILSVNTLYRSFIGVEKAIATKTEDIKVIFSEVLAQFGSSEAANNHLDRVLRERFSASRYELRERDQPLGFRPWPWIYEQLEGGQKLAKSSFIETAPYYDAGIRNTLIYGSQQRTFDLLIESGLIVSIEDKIAHESRTSSRDEIELAYAAREGNINRVREILEHGTNPNRQISLVTPLGHAARGGYTEIILLLLDNGADIEGSGGLSPLACGAYKGHDEVVKLLIEHGADIEGDADGPGTALFQAAAEGHLSTVRLLLNLGANPDAKTEKRATPLLVAAATGHINIVIQLIKVRADLNSTDRRGDTALHHAAANGYCAIVEILIKAGANRLVVDKYGDTAFDLGQLKGKLDAKTLELLRF